MDGFSRDTRLDIIFWPEASCYFGSEWKTAIFKAVTDAHVSITTDEH